MVKSSAAGRVKTRLAREVGTVWATRFYRVAATAVIGRVAQPGRWRTFIAVTPDRAHVPEAWLRNATLTTQVGGNLGDRMQRIMAHAAPGPVVIVGSDIPRIRARHVWSAFQALGGNDAVFGPAPDGGYWLVGLRRSPRILAPFKAVRWSSEHALADTKANLPGARWTDIEVLADVDDARDLASEGGDYGRRVRGNSGTSRVANR
jgi:rSAM/selenodomain-associated transferase 1